MCLEDSTSGSCNICLCECVYVCVIASVFVCIVCFYLCVCVCVSDSLHKQGLLTNIKAQILKSNYIAFRSACNRCTRRTRWKCILYYSTLSPLTKECQSSVLNFVCVCVCHLCVYVFICLYVCMCVLVWECIWVPALEKTLTRIQPFIFKSNSNMFGSFQIW